VISLKHVVPIVILLTFAIAASPAFPQEIAPDALVKAISQDVIAAVKADKDIQAGDSKKIAELADAKINPHFDFRRMTQSAMAKNWRLATPIQQDQLTTGFKTLLVSTYSKALVTYKDRVINFRPLQGEPVGGEVTVRSEVIRPGKPSTIIEYDLAKSAAGWRITDIKVDGVSLVVTYRDTFADQVRNNGIDGLITLLNNKNQQNKDRSQIPAHDLKVISMDAR
jgi:phospholipid transport system substrate-binding protein